MKSPEIMSVTANSGIRWNVRILRDGDKYGLNDRLIVGSSDLEGPGLLVEFYDSRYPHTRFGQFVSRYSVDTIIGLDGYGSGHGGLDLNFDEPSWKIDTWTMGIVRNWLINQASRGRGAR